MICTFLICLNDGCQPHQCWAALPCWVDAVILLARGATSPKVILILSFAILKIWWRSLWILINSWGLSLLLLPDGVDGVHGEYNGIMLLPEEFGSFHV